MPHANGSAEALPPIAALFLVVFDQKIGYASPRGRLHAQTCLTIIVDTKSHGSDHYQTVCLLNYRKSRPRANAQEAQLDGVVEYKSLPSGLHNVQQDLMYVPGSLIGRSMLRTTQLLHARRVCRTQRIRQQASR